MKLWCLASKKKPKKVGIIKENELIKKNKANWEKHD